MSTRSIAILGSTGSIGTSTLNVVSRYGDRFRVIGLVGGNNISQLAKQVKEFRPKIVCARTVEGIADLRQQVGNIPDIEYTYGVSGAEAVAAHSEVDTVVSAIVGAAGLRPTLAAVDAGKRIALANKESLVVAGALVSRRARKSGSELLPVDSEHNAIFQALAGAHTKSVRKIILTASGGPFFEKRELDLSTVTPEQALQHPNWKMGAKITIDSATMMNKGLEIIEAHWLFGFPLAQIDTVIHPQSVIHSLVEYVDGSVLAQLGVPDMCGPIAYALTYPDRLNDVTERLDLAKTRNLTFYEPDHERFPSMQIARKALERGETYPAVLNGANEVTVAAFLEGRIGFLEISRINREVVLSFEETSSDELDDYIAADLWGREQASEYIQKGNR